MYNSVENQDKIFLNDIINRNYINVLKTARTKIYSLYFGENYSNIKCKTCNCACDRDLNYICNIKTYSDIEIFDNIKTAIDFYINNKFVSNIELIYPSIDSSILFKTLDYIYNCFKGNNEIPRTIYLADDCKFLLNEKLTSKVIDYINKFKKINLFIKFTVYLDITDNLIDYKKYYTSLIAFLNHYDSFDLKLILTPENIKDAKEHFQTFNLFKILTNYRKDIQIFESSSDKWDDITIKQLLDFVIYYLNYNYDFIFNKDMESFIDWLLNKDINNNNFVSLASNNIFKENTGINCKIDKSFYINCNDLSIVLCPGMQQEYYKIGYFDFKNTQIVVPNNIPMQITKDYIKRDCLPNCESCKYVDICSGFCFAESFQSHGNFLIANPENCAMKVAKFKTIFKWLKDLNLTDLLLEKCNNRDYYSLLIEQN